MKIAILGAGFTGLTAALKLAQDGHEVTIFEKESIVGGLASGFKIKGWNWYLDKTYHHLFTNDSSAISLASTVNQKLITKRPETAVLVKNQMSAFDSPITLIKFSILPIIDRLRVGVCTFYLKYITSPKYINHHYALIWLTKFMGKNATEMIWNPLFEGKFGAQKHIISLTWFWARIKKRTPSLIYPEGGFQTFAEKVQSEAEKHRVKFNFNSEISNISSLNTKFDKIIVTLPTQVFNKVAKLPIAYQKKLNSIPHLSALNLILVLKKPFFIKETYWLNITDQSFPFLVLAEHTNFMEKKYYNNQHILYIGCYLPENHPYLKMSSKKLLKLFDPYLKKINSSYSSSIITSYLFTHSNAQPIVAPDYKEKIPDFKTPLRNVYLANLDMVYPWDRGVNYAIKLGEDIAKIISKEK
ncbi:MAG: FAD-dependent oxidoreductase [Candidatus Daviesbacteria bacterium]|nr:FAD-dependent oxidoreductase [Candidatus Daviesbacteria bacterium]